MSEKTTFELVGHTPADGRPYKVHIVEHCRDMMAKLAADPAALTFLEWEELELALIKAMNER